MSTHADDRLDHVERELAALRGQLRLHRVFALLVLGGCGAAVTIAASPAAPRDATFDRITARGITINDGGITLNNEKGKPAAHLSAHGGGASLLLRDAEGREAIHLITGKERNDVFVYDRRGDFAAALQGMENGGSFSLHRTFEDQASADAAQPEGPIKSFLQKTGSNRVTIPLVRLPEQKR